MSTIVTAFLLLLMTWSAGANEITGTVADGSGKPLAGAHVYVYTASPRFGVSPICPSCYRDCGKQVTTDDAGAFRLHDLDEALLFDLLVIGDGYESTFVRRVDAATGPVKIALTQRAVADPDQLVAGVVLDPDGKPVSGATVTPRLYHLDDQRWVTGGYPGLDRMSITNARGEFALRIPHTNTNLDVLVTARNFAPKIERTIAPRDRREIRLTEGVAVSGRVTRGGAPVPGVLVKAVQQDRRSSHFLGEQKIGTNEHGLFVLTNLAAEQTYVVHVPMDSGVATEAKLVTTGADGSTADAGTLTVLKGRRLAGTVVLPEGVSLPPNARLSLVRDHSMDFIEIPLQGTSFSVEGIPPGNVQFLLRLPGLRFAPASTGFDPQHGEIIVAGDTDCTDIRLVLEQE